MCQSVLICELVALLFVSFLALLLFHCMHLGPPHLWPHFCSFVRLWVVLLFSCSIVAHIITVVKLSTHLS